MEAHILIIISGVEIVRREAMTGLISLIRLYVGIF
jgi:hypothetical protein